MANIETIHIPAETRLTITFDADTSGHVVRTYSGSQPTDFQSITADSDLILGPYDDERDYRVTLLGGSYTYGLSFAGTDRADLDGFKVTLSEIADGDVLFYDETSERFINGVPVDFANSGDYTPTAGLDAIALSGNYTDLNITPETNVASPTAIAETDLKTAIDGILAILVAKGLMAEEV